MPLEQVKTGGQAGIITPFITKGFQPERWAILTTNLILTAGPGITDEVMHKFVTLKNAVMLCLIAGFNQIKPNMSSQQYFDMAFLITEEIVCLALKTKWAMNFSEPHIRKAIQEVVYRNLVSAGEGLVR